MIFRWIILILGFICLNSCSHFLKTKYKVSHENLASATFYQKLKNSYQSPYGSIPLDSQPAVDRWIQYFRNNGKDYMTSYLERSSRYLPLMKSVLQENKLPLDLVYVALIESGFSSKALSQANAVGYWQFIYGTGKRYGLRIDGHVDERRDPVLSTRAAANYLRDLYSLFGSWHLALAAYNAGEHRINRAVLRHYNRDFWFLNSKKAFPKETRNYIPKLIAAIHIGNNPEKYGFYDLNYQKPIQYELLYIQKPISLLKLAQNIGVSYKEIKSLNPSYKGEYVPIYENQTAIRLPTGKLTLAQATLEKSKMARPKYSYHHYYWYKVRRGDSLYKIALQHKTTVRKIKKENNMGYSSLIRVGKKLKIPTKRLVATKPYKKRSIASVNKEFHVVQKGQTLSRIAQTYNIKLTKLKKLNNIQGTPLIHPGQKMRIKKSVSATQKKYHVVRRGDTLIGVATKHNIPLPKLMNANALSFKSILLTGTRLLIPQLNSKK